MVPEAPCKIPKEEGKQQSHPVVTSVNHSKDQHGMVILRVQYWGIYFGGDE